MAALPDCEDYTNMTDEQKNGHDGVAVSSSVE